MYDLFTSDYMFIGDTCAMIFSRSGTIWGMEGEVRREGDGSVALS